MSQFASDVDAIPAEKNIEDAKAVRAFRDQEVAAYEAHKEEINLKNKMEEERIIKEKMHL